MEFNPRTATGIPTEPVGSIPRPLKLQQAYAAYDAKKITKAELEAEQDAAVADTIKRFEATGSPIITDGEQRISSFATYPIADTLAGTGLAANLAPGGQYFAIFADGHNRQLPKITGGPLHYNFYAGELVKKAVKMTLAKMLPKGVRYRVLHHDSKSNLDLQIADYCNWVIYRKWDRGDSFHPTPWQIAILPSSQNAFIGAM